MQRAINASIKQWTLGPSDCHVMGNIIVWVIIYDLRLSQIVRFKEVFRIQGLRASSRPTLTAEILLHEQATASERLCSHAPSAQPCSEIAQNHITLADVKHIILTKYPKC